MANLGFIVVDPFQFRKTGSIEADMKAYLDKNLQSLVDSAKSQKNPANHTFNVSFTETKPSGTNLDFVIYLIHPLHTSLIMAKDGKRSTMLPGKHWGRTQVSDPKDPNKKLASELRIKEKNGAKLAAIAMHELYHGKLQLEDKDLHPRGGICEGEIDETTTYNAQTKRISPRCSRGQ